MIKRKFCAAFVFVIVLGLSACGSADNDSSDTYSIQGEPIPIETERAAQSAGEQKEDHAAADEELEKNLAAYREKREDWTSVPMGNGVTGSGGKAANPEEFGFSFDAGAVNNFDSRELMEAYGTAKSYVEDTLKVEVTTKNTVYMCVDPRIWEIYKAEDKGVADGYEPDNIFVCEYCDNGTWQYLILVREGKGSAWSVIHHGSSYREE